MHYPGVIEWREKVRERLGLGDNLPRGTRLHSKKQYSKAVELLRSNRYITTQEVADSCGVSLCRFGTAPAVLPQGFGKAAHQDTREGGRTETQGRDNRSGYPPCPLAGNKGEVSRGSTPMCHHIHVRLADSQDDGNIKK